MNNAECDVERFNFKRLQKVLKDVRIWAKESLDHYKVKQCNSLFDEKCSKWLDQRKHAKLQNQSQMNGRNMNNEIVKLVELSGTEKGSILQTKWSWNREMIK
jgi:hypothetical protein